MQGHITHVNTVEAQQRPARRKRGHRGTVGGGKNFFETSALRQLLIGEGTPVVEIAGDYQRRIFWEICNQRAQQFKLALAVALAQAEVNADGVNLLGVIGQGQAAMQQAALFCFAERRVEILAGQDRKF